jgi:hypothetical protein
MPKVYRNKSLWKTGNLTEGSARSPGYTVCQRTPLMHQSPRQDPLLREPRHFASPIQRVDCRTRRTACWQGTSAGEGGVADLRRIEQWVNAVATTGRVPRNGHVDVKRLRPASREELADGFARTLAYVWGEGAGLSSAGMIHARHSAAAILDALCDARLVLQMCYLALVD